MHKHVTVLALLVALQRKDKGFLYFETHAGRGVYNLRQKSSHAAPDSYVDIERFLAAPHATPEIQHYVATVRALRTSLSGTRAYPGSPLLAAHQLRLQDRAVCVEIQPPEARALERGIELVRGQQASNIQVRCGDGFTLLRAFLPPPERRGMILIDPPYEETQADFERVGRTVDDALRRFATGTIMVWYPIKQERETAARLAHLRRSAAREALISELWLYPRDSHVSLNGSGLLIVNPPYQIEERMRDWLPKLYDHLAVGEGGGTAVTSSPP